MKTIGVTIGIGDNYKSYAEKSAVSFQRYTGIEARIIDDKMFSKYDFTHLSDKHNERTWIMKLFMFGLFPDAENIIYFDCDWLAIGNMNLSEYLNRKEIHCVRDRLYKDFVQYTSGNIGIKPEEYFNAGFYIINRTNHKRLLEYCQEIYDSTPKEFGEQCVFNKAVNDLGIDKYFLGKEFNFMDYESNSWAAQNISINAIHTSSTYSLYENNVELNLNNKYKPNRVFMNLMVAAKHKLEIDSVVYDLYPDGFTSGPFFWLISDDNEYIVYDTIGDLITDYKLKLK